MKTLIITLALIGISVLSYNKNAEIGKPVETTDAMATLNKTGSKENSNPDHLQYDIKPLGHVRHLPYTSPYISYSGAKSGEGC